MEGGKKEQASGSELNGKANARASHKTSKGSNKSISRLLPPQPPVPREQVLWSSVKDGVTMGPTNRCDHGPN